LKTLTDLKQHLAEYREGTKSLPNYVELAELCELDNVIVSSADKLIYINDLCKEGKLPDWETNYIFNAWIGSCNATMMTMLNQRQIDFISLLYERNKK
jgi:hypothetical protein